VRITIVQGAFLPVPPLRGGAVEKVWFALAKEFVRRGHQVTHISRLCDGLPTQEEIEGVEHRRVAGFDTPSSLVALKLLDLVYSLRVLPVLPEADILVTNTFWLPMLVRTPRPGAIYVHVARYPKGQMGFYSHCARLQTVSSAVAEAIVAQAPAAAPRVSIVPYPIPESAVTAPTRNEQRQPHILYVGRIHPEKGIDLLIDAFQRLQTGCKEQWRLVLVGPWQTEFGGGGEGYRQALQGRAAAVADRIDWVGGVFDPLALQRYYQQSALFVYPSLAELGETFGLAPLEAMAAGCPVLVSGLKCFRDFIEDGRSGFVFDHRAADPVAVLAEKLKTLLAAPPLLARVGASGHAAAHERTLPRVADQYLADFASLLHP